MPQWGLDDGRAHPNKKNKKPKMDTKTIVIIGYSVIILLT